MKHALPPSRRRESVSTSILQRLRLETREEHLRLEKGLALTEAPLGRERYVELLSRFYGFHAVHEPMLDQVFAQDAFWPQRRRLEPIEHDLRLLGRTDSDIAALPRCEYPAITGRPAAFGCLYVFEGATLGGQLIARHLARQSDLPSGATTYFAGRGRRTGPMWKETCAHIERELAEEAEDAAIEAARATFVALHDWLMPFIGAGKDRP